jgi:hypothetical protein
MLGKPINLALAQDIPVRKRFLSFGESHLLDFRGHLDIQGPVQLFTHYVNTLPKAPITQRNMAGVRRGRKETRRVIVMKTRAR